MFGKRKGKLHRAYIFSLGVPRVGIYLAGIVFLGAELSEAGKSEKYRKSLEQKRIKKNTRRSGYGRDAGVGQGRSGEGCSEVIKQSAVTINTVESRSPGENGKKEGGTGRVPLLAQFTLFSAAYTRDKRVLSL